MVKARDDENESKIATSIVFAAGNKVRFLGTEVHTWSVSTDL
jgi:hypothetical protein